MTKHAIEGDGNCCFSAVAFSLMTNLILLSDEHKSFLRSLGLDFSGDVQSIALKLRQITVAEWIEHSAMYEAFYQVCPLKRKLPNF